jgi:hypothetical protein
MVFRRVEAVRLSTRSPWLVVGEEWEGYAHHYPTPGAPFLFVAPNGRVATSPVVRVLCCDDVHYVQTCHSLYRVRITEVESVRGGDSTDPGDSMASTPVA